MKTKKYFAFALTLCSSATYAGSVCQSNLASMTCGKGQVSQVNVNGTATLNGTNVKGPTSTNGSFTANNATLQSLAVNGSAALSNVKAQSFLINGATSISESTISGNATANGSFQAVNTTFDGDVRVGGSRVNLNASTVKKNLEVKARKTPTVILTNASKISGDIKFTEATGVVQMDAKSSIAGQVVNGKIEKI